MKAYHLPPAKGNHHLLFIPLPDERTLQVHASVRNRDILYESTQVYPGRMGPKTMSKLWGGGFPVEQVDIDDPATFIKKLAVDYASACHEAFDRVIMKNVNGDKK